jgi:hypothetical protein
MFFVSGVALFFDGFMMAVQPDAWPFWLACACVSLAGLTYMGVKR